MELIKRLVKDTMSYNQLMEIAYNDRSWHGLKNHSRFEYYHQDDKVEEVILYKDTQYGYRIIFITTYGVGFLFDARLFAQLKKTNVTNMKSYVNSYITSYQLRPGQLKKYYKMIGRKIDSTMLQYCIEYKKLGRNI